MSPLARLVDDAMKRREWSTRDVERHGGPPYSTTARIINPGVRWRRPPGDETLEKLGKALRIPVSRLQQAAAETVGWNITDRSPSEHVRTIVAAMSTMDGRTQQAIADVVLILGERLEEIAAAAELVSARDLMQRRNQLVHGGPAADYFFTVPQQDGSESVIALEIKTHGGITETAAVEQLLTYLRAAGIEADEEGVPGRAGIGKLAVAGVAAPLRHTTEQLAARAGHPEHAPDDTGEGSQDTGDRP
jgi:hypothetical protein